MFRTAVVAVMITSEAYQILSFVAIYIALYAQFDDVPSAETLHKRLNEQGIIIPTSDQIQLSSKEFCILEDTFKHVNTMSTGFKVLGNNSVIYKMENMFNGLTREELIMRITMIKTFSNLVKPSQQMVLGIPTLVPQLKNATFCQFPDMYPLERPILMEVDEQPVIPIMAPSVNMSITTRHGTQAKVQVFPNILFEELFKKNQKPSLLVVIIDTSNIGSAPNERQGFYNKFQLLLLRKFKDSGCDAVFLVCGGSVNPSQSYNYDATLDPEEVCKNLFSYLYFHKVPAVAKLYKEFRGQPTKLRDGKIILGESQVDNVLACLFKVLMSCLSDNVSSKLRSQLEFEVGGAYISEWDPTLNQISECLLVTADNNEPGETQFCGFGVQKDEISFRKLDDIFQQSTLVKSGRFSRVLPCGQVCSSLTPILRL